MSHTYTFSCCQDVMKHKVQGLKKTHTLLQFNREVECATSLLPKPCSNKGARLSTTHTDWPQGPIWVWRGSGGGGGETQTSPTCSLTPEQPPASRWADTAAGRKVREADRGKRKKKEPWVKQQRDRNEADVGAAAAPLIYIHTLIFTHM